MRDRGVEMLLLKREMETKITALMEHNLPVLPKDVMMDIQFNPGTVKFGSLSFQEDKEEHPENHMNGDVGDHKADKPVGKSPSKPDLVTTDTQTESIDSSEENIHNQDLKAELDYMDCSSLQEKQENQFLSNGQTASVQMCNQHTSTTVSSADVSLNTQTIPMLHKGLQVYSDPGTPGSGICAKCCEDLSTSAPFLEEAPKIQDIIVLNTTDKDSREWRRRRRYLIRSKRVQTDLTLSGDLLDDKSKSLPMLNKIPNRSLSCDDTSVSRPEMRTIALDPINCDEPGRRFRRRMRDKTTMTIGDMKPIVDMCDASTYTYPSRLRSFGTCTKVETSNTDTQTYKVNQVTRSAATDYAGQTDQCTATTLINMIDSETSMPSVVQDNKGTWTEPVATSDRSMCTDNCETTETSMETMQPEICDQGIQITPTTKDSNTSPIPLPQRDQIIQVSIDELEPSPGANRKSWHAGASIFSKLFKSKSSSANNSEQDIPAATSRDVQVEDASTETTSVILCDKETGTPRTTVTDQWTLTPSPVMVNTGISPRRPATMDTGVETTKVTSMDQATYTETKQYKDSETETTIIVQDNETLTERVKMQDAQTSVQIPQDTDETNTDPVILQDANMSTDDDWLEKLKPDSSSVWTETLPPDVMTSSTNTITIQNSDISTNISLDELVPRMDRSTAPMPTNTQDRGTMALSFGQTAAALIDVNTQTSEICFIDKSVCTFEELEPAREDVVCSDMATSTESLPYIGLLSELEGDELFLIPESAFDIASNEPVEENDRDNIEMIDDGTATDFVPLAETSSQTIISSAWQYEDPDEDQLSDLIKKEKDGKVLYDVGVNTIPKLTFEKQTSTVLRHSFSRGTMTLDLAKSDKSTSTYSHTRHIAETCFGQKPLSDVAHKVISTTTTETVDMATNTDSSLMDERMAACISKLRSVSERLQSPTGKNAPDYPWKRAETVSSSERSLLTDSFIKDADMSPRQPPSDDERRKNIMHLVSQTETLTKTKENKHDSMPGRKAQPITTLKGKLAPPVNEQEQKSKSLPREYTDQIDGSPKLSGRVSPSRLPRYNSAPGRIATVPNKSLGKVNVAGSKIPVCQQHKGAEQEGTVCESAHVKPKQPRVQLPAITETHTPPSCSDSGSDASFVSATSEHLCEGNMDFTSLKINVPPNRMSPSFLTVPDEVMEPLVEKTEHHQVDQDDKKPAGFMQKLFSKNSKKKRNSGEPRPQTKPKQLQQPQQPQPQQQQRHSTGKKFVKPPATEQPKPKSPKPRKKQAFVYVRQRIFSIQQDNVEDLKEMKKDGKQSTGDSKKPDSKPQTRTKGDNDRPPSQYDNL